MLAVDLESASLHTAKAVAASTPPERRQRQGPSGGGVCPANSKQLQPAENEFLGGQLPEPRSGWVQENEGDGGREGIKGGKAKAVGGTESVVGVGRSQNKSTVKSKVIRSNNNSARFLPSILPTNNTNSSKNESKNQVLRLKQMKWW